MYVEANKAIHGTLEASLLFWAKLSNSLEKMVYQRNKYNWCVMNKIIKGEEYTILWNVNGLKMLHVYVKDVSVILADIDTKCGKVAKMNITRGEIYKYLGITINNSFSGKVNFSMVKYFGNIIENFQEDIKGESATPARHHLFDTSEDAIKLFQSDTYFFTMLWHRYCTCQS